MDHPEEVVDRHVAAGVEKMLEDDLALTGVLEPPLLEVLVQDSELLTPICQSGNSFPQRQSD
jgi:hypothetical protein